MVVPAGRARQSSRPHGGAAAAATAAGGLTSAAETLLFKLRAVQRDLSPEQAVVIAARTGCTADAALAFWKEKDEARERCFQEAIERSAANAAAAAAEGKPFFIVPETPEEVQALIASAAAAREAATAKLRALQDAAGEGLRDASVTGQFVSLMASLTSNLVRCRACAAISGSSKLVRRKLVAAAGFLTTLEEWFEPAVTAQHITLLLAALAALESLPLEAPLLRSSGCAGLLRTVRQLAKHFDKDVAAAAGELASRWQAVLQGGPAGLSTFSALATAKQEPLVEQQQQQRQRQQAKQQAKQQQAEQAQQQAPQQAQQAQQQGPKQAQQLPQQPQLERSQQQAQQAQQQTPEQTEQQAEQPPRKKARQKAVQQHAQQQHDSTHAAAMAAAQQAGKAPAAADSSAGKDGEAAVPALPGAGLALKDRPLFKKIVRTLHAAKKGGSSGTAITASAAGTAGTAGTAGGAGTPTAAAGRAVQTLRSAPGASAAAGGSSAPLASARSSAAGAAAAAAAAAGGSVAQSGTHSMAAPAKSSPRADAKVQPSGMPVSASQPPPQQQQTAGSAKRPRAEGEASGAASGDAGPPASAKRQQKERRQRSGGSQAPQHARQGAQQPRQQLQVQVQWQPPPAFELPVADDPVAFGEDSTAAAAMAAARARGQQLPDAPEDPVVQEAPVPDLPYVPPDAQDAQQQEQALRAAGWRPPA